MAEEYEDGSIEWHESGNIYGDAETVYEFYLYESNVLKEHVTQHRENALQISMSMLKNENDSKDAVQAAILTAYEKLSTLKKGEYFKTWFVRILINVCNNQLNSRKRVTEIQQNYNFQSTIESSAENIEVRLAVESLPIKIRQIIVLYYIEQFTTKEISSILRIPKGTVMSRLAKGRKLLRMELE